MIDPNLMPLIEAIGTCSTALIGLVAVVLGFKNKTSLTGQDKVLADIHINTNSRLDQMFKLLKDERVAAEDIADHAREAAVTASSKATRDVADATKEASNRAAGHALNAQKIENK